jgi:hypothetical protein
VHAETLSLRLNGHHVSGRSEPSEKEE